MTSKPRTPTSYLMGLVAVISMLASVLSLTPGTAEAASADLYISEYVEGSSNNKAIEIANTTGVDVDLSTYTVELYSNGNTARQAEAVLTGSLADGAVFVIANASSVPEVLAVADITSGVANFNGDDVVVLLNNGVIIDVFGQYQVDPGSEWPGGGQNDTLRRKPTICDGDTNQTDAFDASVEWDTFPQDTFDGLGSHTADCGGDPVIPGQALPFSDNFTSDDCTDGGWQVISVDADQDNTWSCSAQFSNADVNGFGDTAPADEWLITPALDMNAQADEALNFDSFTSFIDVAYPQLEVVYSNDYDGAGDPTTATWTALDGITFSPEGSGEYTPSGAVDLSGISGTKVYFAFHYTSSGTGGGQAATWRIDSVDFAVDDGPTEPTSALIHEVQGSGPTAALIDQTVTVQAVVTSLFESNDALDGFFIQEEDADADGDPATSEAVFVFCRFGDGCPPALAVGDLVTVTGDVTEFSGMTQIDTGSGSITVDSVGNTLPTATVVTLPATGSTEAEATFENIEGMIVTIAGKLVVSEYFELARYGQIVLTADARPEQFTDANSPDAAGYAAFLADLATRQIVLDDNNSNQWDARSGNEPFAPQIGGLSLTNKFRGGDSINDLTGVIHWNADAWRVRQIDTPYSFTSENPGTAVPDDVGGTLKVASFNVLNYFLTLNERGANSAAELDRQRAKIVAALVAMDADVVGLIEIENDNDGAVADLVDALNAELGAGTYDYVATGTIGTDAIKQAFIYKPATVSAVGAFAVLDSSVDPTFYDDKNRPALIQTFEEISTGARVTVAVNHLKSKGSDCNDLGDPDLDDGQARCNLTRTAAAQALANYLATDPTGSGDADSLIIGDLNAYAMEDPITALEAAGYTDMLEQFQGPGAYGYVFDGQTGYLDYAMANADLQPQVTGVTSWHINADEVNVFDYNDDVLDPGESDFFEPKSSALPMYAPDQFRSSDHDPVIVGLALGDPVEPNVTISILHNNDGESKLLPNDDFPGIARFVTTLRDLQDNAGTDGVVTLTSGDNFLASKEFNASLDNGAPYYDSIALSGLYDAMALGNHDFDFGPDVTAAFVAGFDPAIPFLSANADFSAEPLLAALVASGQIAGSTVIDVAGTQVGVIGAVTPLLPSISSPRNVVISADVAGAVNGEVASLEAAGVNKIILISHLQGVDEDRALIPLLSGVDVAIAGGGDELFANPGDTCAIGDVADSYPGAVVDADGVTVPLVTGPGGYRCIGQLDVTFTPEGELVSATGSANLVPLDAVPDPTVLADVEGPISAAVAALENNVLGVSEVDLDGVRTSVRTTSSNEGSLLVDALLDAGTRLAGDFGAVVPIIGLQNGGGIRNDAVIPAGDITEGDTFDIAPFSNFVVVTEIPRETLKELLEVAYGGLPAASGRFAQPAGFSVRVNAAAQAREIDSTCAVIGSSGERVLDVVLDDGAVIVDNGVVVPGPDLPLATIDFLARGGDCYPLGDLGFTALGVSYQQALADYIGGALAGTITAADYPAGGTGRVVIVDNGIAPTLSLPGDITVDATSEFGAIVEWTATAVDDVDGDVAVTCSPASGETFAIGVTTVDCQAIDSSFNTGVGSFIVTVSDLVETSVRDELQAINDALGDIDGLNRKDARRVAQAQRALDRADRNSYWQDGDNSLSLNRGHSAMSQLTKAVAQLDRVDNPAVELLVQDLLDQMRALSQSAIDAAIDGGGSTFFIDWAQHALESGNSAAGTGAFTTAAYWYRASWFRAWLAALFAGW